MSFPQPDSRPVHYPESDGRPLAETEIHLRQIFDLYASLSFRFKMTPEVHVSSNLLLYYQEDNPKKVVAPDVMVVFGIQPGMRRVYRLWDEKRGPSVVFEITSAGSRLEDRGTKKEIYAIMGVAEYYLFDPTGDYLRPPLRAYRLHGDDYLESVERPIISPALNLRLQIVDGFLRLADPVTENLIPIPEELVREAELARERAQREADLREEAEKRTRRAEERARGAERRAAHEALLRQAAEEGAARETLARQAAEERARLAEEALERLHRHRT